MLVFLTKTGPSASFANSPIKLETYVELRLYVIDSSPAIRRLVEQAASTEGFEVTAYSDGPSALDEAGRAAPRMIIADFHLEGITFTTFCDKLSDLNLIPSTMLVVLVNSSDRLEEGSLRARGVSAFVRKPVHVEDLRQTIKKLNEGRMAASQPKPARARKAWPPQSVTMGEDGPTVMEDEAPLEIREPAKKLAPIAQPITEDLRPASAAIAAAAAARNNKLRQSQPEPPAPPEPEPPPPVEPPRLEQPVEPPPPPQPPVQKQEPSEDHAPAVAAILAESAPPEDKPFQFKPSELPAEPEPPLPPRKPVEPPVVAESANGLPSSLEESMRTFLSNLLQSLSAGSQGQISQLVSGMVAQHVNAELSRRIQAEVAAQVAAALAQEEIARAAREAAERKLPELVAERVGTLEQSLRQDISNRAHSMVEDIASKLVRDLAEPAVQKHLPDMVQQHMGSVDGLVKDAAKQAAVGYTRDVAEQIVRQVADEQVGQLVMTAVADIAEAQIKKELERLTASD